MPFTKTNICEIVEFLCKKNRIDSKKAFKQLEESKLFKMEPLWASKQAKDYANDNNLDYSKLETIKDRRICLDDVKLALGEDLPEKVEKSKIFPFASKIAKDKAEGEGYTESDFSSDERNGLTRKTKEKLLITMDDVRNKLGTTLEGKKNIFASKKAEDYLNEMAEKYDIDLEKIEKTGNKGKIKKSDIDNYLRTIEEKEEKDDMSVATVEEIEN